jgi:hypothetical protein
MSETIQDNIRKVMNKSSTEYLPYILVGLIVLLFLIYIVNKITLNQSNCLTLKYLYTSSPNIKNIDFTKDDYKHQLRDYYVKSSYNSCCGGHFKNDYVSICALENVLKNGARFLDFEIYAKDDKPIIGASSSAEYSYKEMYNHVEFEEAMKKIRDTAFTDITPNNDDPLILNFRIKTNNVQVHDIMAKDIYYAFGRNFLNNNYKFENQGNNLGEVELKDLKRTVLISVDKSNTTYKSTKLYSYVNIASGSSFLRTYRNYDIEYATNLEEITNFNKGSMAIVLPDYQDSNDNKPFMIAKEAGVQFIAMNFQKFDAAFKMYSLLFDAAGSAFILKPDHLRFHDIPIEEPTESNSLPDGSADYNCNETDSYKPSGIDLSRDLAAQEPESGGAGDTQTTYDATKPYIQHAVTYVENCDKQNGFIEDILGKAVVEDENLDDVKDGLRTTPAEKYFDNYNISTEADGPFPHITQELRHDRWVEKGKNWGDWYCQQFQDEKGKCVNAEIKKEKNTRQPMNVEKIVCKKQGDDFWEKTGGKNWGKGPMINGTGKMTAKNLYNYLKNNYDNGDYKNWGSNLKEGSIIEWVGNKMRFDKDLDLYEVRNCEDYSGILGLNNYDIKGDPDFLWRNHFIDENPDNKEFQIKTYSKSNFGNTLTYETQKTDIRKQADKYCEQAVYGYDEFNNPKKCTFSHVNTDPGKKKVGKLFNIEFLKKGKRHEDYKKKYSKKINYMDKNKKKDVPYIKTEYGEEQRPFWMVHCKKPE